MQRQENMQSHSYAIDGGTSGASRLQILSRIMWPETERLFQRIGVDRGKRCLDVGCGTGDVTTRLAEMTASQTVGIDMDATAIAVARRQAQEHMSSAVFFEGRVEDLDFAGEFDIVYGRFILSHVREPLVLLHAMKRAAKPGGFVVVEDVNMSVQISYPASADFQRYIALFVEVVERMGACANIGPELPSMFREAGFADVDANISTPLLYRAGPEKQIGSLTLRAIRNALIEHQVASAEEVDALTARLEAFERRPDSLLTTAQIFQVWGQR